MNRVRDKQLSLREPLDLRFLPDEGLEFDEELPADWLATHLADSTSPTPIHAEKSGRAKLEVSPLGPVHTRPPIRIHGTLEATVSTTCVRCLEPVSETLEPDVDITLFAEGTVLDKKRDDDDDEEGLSSAEMDEGTYAAGTIDIPAIIREVLLLELSMNPTCEDEAACTTRTEEMLAEANRAAEGAIPDRWAALRRLRDS
jgi:uncharacterized metal-binding protein YceD (DUF177 family)